MSKEIAQGIIDSITCELMQPEVYEGLDSKFAFFVNKKNQNGENSVGASVNADAFFLVSVIFWSASTLGDSQPKFLEAIRDAIEEKIAEKSTH